MDQRWLYGRGLLHDRTLAQSRGHGGRTVVTLTDHSAWDGSGDYFDSDRRGILVGSILSAVVAYIMLHISLPHSTARDAQAG